MEGDYLNLKRCVAICLSQRQGEIKRNLALIAAGKKTLKWLLIYHLPAPPHFHLDLIDSLMLSLSSPECCNGK